MPSRGMLADDGSLLLAIDVQREHSPEDSGWHWIIVNPEVTSVLTGQAPRDQGDDLRYPVSVGWAWRATDATIWPKLLDPGLNQADSMPAGYTGFEPRRVVSTDRPGIYRIEPVHGALLPAPEFIISPSFERVKSESREFSEKTRDILLMPVYLVGFVFVMGIWVVSGMEQSPI